MATYTHDYSLFPEEVFVPHGFLDAGEITEGSSEETLVKQVMDAISKRDYAKAETLLGTKDSITGKILLEPYTLNAEHINIIEEELRNIELYTISQKQSVFYMNDEPVYCTANDIWIMND